MTLNIQSIDDKHKKLVTLVNDRYDAMRSGKGQQIMGNILDELIDYTKAHFAMEEQLMLIHTSPGYLVHKKEHYNLTQHVVQPVITVALISFLKDWLSTHIKGTDQKYAPFMINKGAS